MKTLIIVESPTKADKIQKFLDDNYIVLSSKGHITDLIKGGNHGIGIDIDNNFKPKYVLLPDKVSILDKIMNIAKECDQILIASDPDREGEAIAWHLKNRLYDLGKPIKRFTFNEITEKAVTQSLNNLRDIDLNLFHSQEARRILDRIVGFSVSSFLMSIYGPKLSAGRVQSVVVRMIIDREMEIDSFKPEEFWTIKVNLTKDGNISFVTKYDGKILDKNTADTIASSLSNKDYIVSDILSDENKKFAPPPLITATLQQTMSKIYGITADRTMRAAQSLYENGYCTYIRTDSVRTEDDALKNLREWLKENKYDVSEKINVFKNKDLSQDAHECIRPTDLNVRPDTYELANPDEKKVYEAIWKHFVASQMKPAVFNTLKIVAHVKDNPKLKVKASGKSLKELGYLKVLDYNIYSSKIDIPNLSVGDNLKLFGNKPIKSERKFTQPPSRFSEADLIEELKKRSIGRPATYADILSKITSRNYVIKHGNVYRPTDLGKKIVKTLIDFFTFMDYNYTADLEKQLDHIAENKMKHIDMLSSFYQQFKSQLYNAYINFGSEICKKCNSPMLIKESKNKQKFWGCINYPKCNSSKSYNVSDYVLNNV
jgi:DNA topoisomerase-1